MDLIFSYEKIALDPNKPAGPNRILLILLRNGDRRMRKTEYGGRDCVARLMIFNSAGKVWIRQRFILFERGHRFLFESEPPIEYD